MEVNTSNLQAREVVFEVSKANRQALLLFVPMAVLILTPYWMIWQDQFTLDYFRALSKNTTLKVWGTGIALIVIVAGIVAHELIHGVTWAKYAKGGFKSISFGVLWKELTPYCHCSEALKVKHYIVGASMPAIVLGLVPACIAYATGSLTLICFALFFTVAAAGDFMIINKLRFEDQHDFVQDHPTKIGYIMYRDSDMQA